MKRKVTALLLAIALVAIMAVPASAGSTTVDLTYVGETYTISAKCVTRIANANIITECSTTTVGVKLFASDDSGMSYEDRVMGKTYEATLTFTPDSGKLFTSATGTYYVNGSTIATRTVTP